VSGRCYILPRRRSDGTIGWMATIRLHNKKKLVHRETKTFSRRAAAEKWARAREVELEDPAALVRARAGDVTLASLIRWYIDSFQHVSKWQRTKQSQLRFLEKNTGAAFTRACRVLGMIVRFDVELDRREPRSTVKVNGQPVSENVATGQLDNGDVGLITHWAPANSTTCGWRITRLARSQERVGGP
jgi:hypothetical protein